MSLHQLKSVQFNSVKNNVIFQFQVSNSGPCLPHFWKYVDYILAHLHCSPDIDCTCLGSTLDYARSAWKQTYRAVMNQGLHQWNQGNQWDFIITEAPFAPCLELQSYRIKGVSLEIFPWGLSALNNTTHGSVTLSLSFLRLAATSDLDAKWMLLEAVAKHFFSLCARHVIHKCFYRHFSKSTANMLEKKNMFPFLSFFFFCFVLGRITTSVFFFLMTSVSLKISNEIQSSHCFKELHLRCLFKLCLLLPAMSILLHAHS